MTNSQAKIRAEDSHLPDSMTEAAVTLGSPQQPPALYCPCWLESPRAHSRFLPIVPPRPGAARWPRPRWWRPRKHRDRRRIPRCSLRECGRECSNQESKPLPGVGRDRMTQEDQIEIPGPEVIDCLPDRCRRREEVPGRPPGGVLESGERCLQANPKNKGFWHDPLRFCEARSAGQASFIAARTPD